MPDAESGSAHVEGMPQPDGTRNESLPLNFVARRTGLPLDDARLRFVGRWITDKLAEEHRLMDAIDGAKVHDRQAAMRAFNAATEARRVQLVLALGEADASRVADEFCLYRFDVDAGNWHRIDACGARVAFRHEDDDLWRGGERGNRAWRGDRRL